MRNRVLRASLHTKAAEYATSIIDVIYSGIALIHSYALVCGTGVVCRNDIDAVRRACGSAKETRDAFLFAHLVDVQQMLSAISWLDGDGLVRILDGPFLLRNIGECHPHSVNDRLGGFDYIGEY
jgi:hypothetical protein